MEIKKYETALRDDVLTWIKDIEKVDVLVGIPSFNSEDTIKKVIKEVIKGLVTYFPGKRKAILISDGGSLDNTREKARAVELPKEVERKVTIYRGRPGKGTSFRGIFEAATLLKVKACVVVDSDLKSIKPEWIKYLAEPVMKGKAEYITPHYLRHKYDSTITNLIVYPLTRALYGYKIRQPIGGEFGLSRDIASFFFQQDVWDTDVAGFGIDIWMTTLAINEGFKIGQANLGLKIHQAKDPSADLSYMLKQVLGTLFYMMGEYKKNWIKITKSHEVTSLNRCEKVDKLKPITVDFEKLTAEFINGFNQFSPLYKEILNHDNFFMIQETVEKAKAGEIVGISNEVWARTIFDFAFTFHAWACNRRRLIDILTPLYFGRTASHFYKVDSLSNEQAEKLVEKQAEAFEKEKHYLVEKFRVWGNING